MDEHGHMLYVSDYTNEKVPAADSSLWWLVGLPTGVDYGVINGRLPAVVHDSDVYSSLSRQQAKVSGLL